MYSIKFTHRGERDLKRLTSNIRERLNKKLVYYASLQNPLVPARPLVNLPPSTHRYRIGKHRVSFFVKRRGIFVERIEIRGRAYRR